MESTFSVHCSNRAVTSSISFLAKKNEYNFLKSLREIRNNANKNLIHFVYFLAKEKNKDLDEIEEIILNGHTADIRVKIDALPEIFSS